MTLHVTSVDTSITCCLKHYTVDLHLLHMQLLEIQGSHRITVEHLCCLGYDTMSISDELLEFWRRLQPLSSGYKQFMTGEPQIS
jgi:hypothetical protein